MTSSVETSQAQGVRTRREWVAYATLAVCGAATALFWSLSLREALRPRPPRVLLRAPAEAVAGEPFPVQVLAFDELRKKRLPLRGRVRLNEGSPIDFRSDLATPVVPHVDVIQVAEAVSPDLPATIRVRLELSAENIPLHFDVPVRLLSAPRRLEPASWVPWEQVLAFPSPAELQGPPVYPIAGRARSALRTEAWVFQGDRVVQEPLEPNAASVRLADGRSLKLDRSGVTIELPPFASAGTAIPVRLQTSSAGKRLLMFFADERIQRVSHIDLPAGETELALTLPAAAAEGTTFEVHLSVSELNLTSAAVGFGMVWSNPQVFTSGYVRPEIAAELRLAPLFQSVQDPLLVALLEGRVPQEPGIWRALFARFRTHLTFPGRIGPSAEEQVVAAERSRAAKVATFRRPFRVCAIMLALLSTVFAWRAGQRSRALEALLREESSLEAEGTPLQTSLWARWGGGVWAGFGLAAALCAIWALDWVLHFVLL